MSLNNKFFYVIDKKVQVLNKIFNPYNVSILIWSFDFTMNSSSLEPLRSYNSKLRFYFNTKNFEFKEYWVLFHINREFPNDIAKLKGNKVTVINPEVRD